MIPLIALLLSSLGIAADSRAEVLFSKGDAADAVQDVRRALGEGGDRADLAVQNLHDVLGENPSVIGGGSVERCANPPLSPYVPGADADALASRLAEVQALIDGVPRLRGMTRDIYATVKNNGAGSQAQSVPVGEHQIGCKGGPTETVTVAAGSAARLVTITRKAAP